jgi:hypothetical protein
LIERGRRVIGSKFLINGRFLLKSIGDPFGQAATERPSNRTATQAAALPVYRF